MAKLPHLIKKKAIENGAVDGEVIKLLEGQSVKAIHNGQEVELIKPVDGKVQVLGSEVELKSSSESKLVEAKAYADQIKSDIMGGLPATALDTIKELADAIQADGSVVEGVISNVSSISSALNQEISDRQAAVSAEQSAREAAVSSLQSQISSAVSNASGSASADLSAEEAARIAADNVLDGKILAEKSRAEGVEATLSSSIASETSARQSADSALDSRLTSVENGKAGKSYVDSTFETKSAHNADKAAMEASFNAEKTLRESEEARIEGKIDSEIVTRANQDAQVLADAKSYSDQKLIVAQNYSDSQDSAKLLEAKSYTDGKISDLIGGAPAMMDTLKEISDAIAAGDSVATSLASQISSEISRAQAEESSLDGKITTEKNRAEAAESSLSSSISSSLVEAKSYSDSAVLVEKNRAESAESSISSSLSSEVSRAQSEEATMLKLDGSRPMTGVLNMGSNKITGLVPPTDNSDAAGKGYVDGKFNAEASARSSGDASVTAAFQAADQSVTSAFQAADSTITSNLNSEISRAQSAESALSSRVTVIEAMSFGKEKLTISGSVPSTFELAQLAHTNSIHVFVGAIPLHEGVGEGFTVSVSNGKSLISFNTDALSVGDKVFFYYHY